MNEMANDRKRHSINRSRLLHSDTQSDNRPEQHGAYRCSACSSRVSGGTATIRNQTKTTERFIQWTIVALSVVGIVGVALTAIVGG